MTSERIRVDDDGPEDLNRLREQEEIEQERLAKYERPAVEIAHNRQDLPVTTSRRVIPGYFMIEGMDGGGKTTLIREAVSRLTTAGYLVRTLKEPGSSPLGNWIRELTSSSHMALDAESDPSLATLMMAARVSIASRLGNLSSTRYGVSVPGQIGRWLILSDRGFPSSFIYQSTFAEQDPEDSSIRVYPRSGMEWEDLWLIHERLCFKKAFPQVVFLMDVTPSQVRHRMLARSDERMNHWDYDAMNPSYAYQQRRRYLSFMRSLEAIGVPVVVLDSSKPFSELVDRILQVALTVFPQLDRAGEPPPADGNWDFFWEIDREN